MLPRCQEKGQTRCRTEKGEVVAGDMEGNLMISHVFLLLGLVGCCSFVLDAFQISMIPLYSCAMVWTVTKKNIFVKHQQDNECSIVCIIYVLFGPIV